MKFEGDTGVARSTNMPMDMAANTVATPQPGTYALGELFAGAGGMALGAHRAKYRGNGFRHVWVNDLDFDACETLKNNLPLPEGGSCCGPVEDLDFDSMAAIDGLAFGFPCNDFSVVGDRHGISGRFGGLYRWGVKALEAKQPSFFVAENVSGLGSSGKAGDFQTILRALEGAGYDLFTHKYRFEEYGIPQTRHRIIITGFRKEYGIDYAPPEPTTKEQPVTAGEALRDLPEAVANNELTNQSARVVERLQHIRPGENAFTASLPEHLRLNLKSGATISQIYKRLRHDQPAYTVTGSGGGGTHVYHWTENRALTNRERARLQSFPDSYVFTGGKESVRKQIGMAVPPHGAEIIFRSVLKTLVEYGVPVGYRPEITEGLAEKKAPQSEAFQQH